jgi:hypothetical protein
MNLSILKLFYDDNYNLRLNPTLNKVVFNKQVHASKHLRIMAVLLPSIMADVTVYVNWMNHGH